MYIKKSDVEDWVNHIIKDLQNFKAENDIEQLEHIYQHAHGKITMLFFLDLITGEQYKKLLDQMYKIAYE